MLEDKETLLLSVAALKKELLIMRVKLSLGDVIKKKTYKIKKKEVARLFTKLKMLEIKT